MQEELDIILLTDEEGNEVRAEILDYFFAEGQEYAILAEVEDEEEHNCEDCECGCDAEREVFIMKVIAHDDDTEEFVSIEDELADSLFKFYEENMMVEDEEGDEEDDEDEEENEDGDKE